MEYWLQHWCKGGQRTTFTIPYSEDSHRRGHYQHTVSQLLPCSAVSWELASQPHNVTLYQDFLLTDPEPDHSSPFTLLNGRVRSVRGWVRLSWELSQPCVEEYKVRLCHSNQQSCWSATLERPDLQSLAEGETQMQVELSSLEGFNSLCLEDCQQALVTVEPGGSNSPHGEFILPFTFINTCR